MHKDKIIEALEEAKRNNVPFGKGAYHRGDAYCVIGYMAKAMGIPEQYIGEAMDDIDEYWSNMKYFYGVESFDPLIHLNDAKWTSWDDAISYFKELQDEHK